MLDLKRAVVKPLVTEKSSAAYAARKEFAFVAHPQATKREIKAAIEALFGVTVVAVRTMQQPAKQRSMGRTVGRRARWKKAYVRLKEGDTIPVFEG